MSTITVLDIDERIDKDFPRYATRIYVSCMRDDYELRGYDAITVDEDFHRIFVYRMEPDQPYDLSPNYHLRTQCKPFGCEVKFSLPDTIIKADNDKFDKNIRYIHTYQGVEHLNFEQFVKHMVDKHTTLTVDEIIERIEQQTGLHISESDKQSAKIYVEEHAEQHDNSSDDDNDDSDEQHDDDDDDDSDEQHDENDYYIVVNGDLFKRVEVGTTKKVQNGVIVGSTPTIDELKQAIAKACDDALQKYT